MKHRLSSFNKSQGNERSSDGKMSGGDLPKWDADMEYWLSLGNICDDPHYIASEQDCDSFEVSGEINVS